MTGQEFDLESELRRLRHAMSQVLSGQEHRQLNRVCHQLPNLVIKLVATRKLACKVVYWDPGHSRCQTDLLQYDFG